MEPCTQLAIHTNLAQLRFSCLFMLSQHSHLPSMLRMHANTLDMYNRTTQQRTPQLELNKCSYNKVTDSQQP